jgi:hypothetical protein
MVISLPAAQGAGTSALLWNIGTVNVPSSMTSSEESLKAVRIEAANAAITRCKFWVT